MCSEYKIILIVRNHSHLILNHHFVLFKNGTRYHSVLREIDFDYLFSVLYNILIMYI